VLAEWGAGRLQTQPADQTSALLSTQCLSECSSPTPFGTLLSLVDFASAELRILFDHWKATSWSNPCILHFALLFPPDFSAARWSACHLATVFSRLSFGHDC